MGAHKMGGGGDVEDGDTSRVTIMQLNPRGPRTQIIGPHGPNTIISMVFGPGSPSIWVLGLKDLGLHM